MWISRFGWLASLILGRQMTRRPQEETSTAFIPPMKRAPASTAKPSRRESKSLRGMADPRCGKREWAGHGAVIDPPKPCNFSPRISGCPSSRCPAPIASSAPTARGVRPSPQVLSLGDANMSNISTTITSQPALAAWNAAEAPAGPAPITRTSVLMVSVFMSPKASPRNSKSLSRLLLVTT